MCKMIIVKSKRYVKKHVVGGAGIFDTVSNFFKKLASSSAAQQVAKNLSKAAASDIGKKAIDAAKTVGKELATSAISTAKDIAIDKGKKLIAKASSKGSLPPVITQKSKDILTSLVDRTAQAQNSEAQLQSTNLNKLLAGQGLQLNNAIRIQDLVKKLNGGGLRLAVI